MSANEAMKDEIERVLNAATHEGMHAIVDGINRRMNFVEIVRIEHSHSLDAVFDLEDGRELAYRCTLHVKIERQTQLAEDELAVTIHGKPDA
jgi:hypothetical protein